MAGSVRRPASARSLYRALDELGAAPTPDPVLRPDGPKRADSALLLGVLLAKTELDAAVRADPAQEPPRGMTELFTGYRSLITSPGDGTRLQLLSHRLLRSAVETTLDNDNSRFSQAASDAALAASGLIDADRLQRIGASSVAVQAAVDAAALSLRAAAAGITSKFPGAARPARRNRR
ncbi:hypothetical protein ABWJ92_38180 [Streptomyces sp. NPDC000609]|uniref:hypothetical protein n=1 Tax=Streptomyces sp. NPDC000609 TaxID=3160957 RepID=UPI00339472B2